MTFVELLASVATILVLASVAILALTGIQENVTAVKLHNDVRTLNEAMNVYEGNGGSLTGLTEIPEILAKLKTTTDADSRKWHQSIS